MSQAVPNRSASELFGVHDQPRNAYDRLIWNAIDLFYRYGFQAVGIDQILAEAGVAKTTFYKHFASKDDLMIAAIKTRDDWERKAWARAVQMVAGDDPKAQLLGFFDVLDRWFNDPAFGGCLFINAAAEFPNPNDPVHQTAAEHKKANRGIFCDLARKAGAGDPDSFADQFTVLIEGTLILRQVHHRDDAARLSRALAEQLVETHMPAG